VGSGENIELGYGEEKSRTWRSCSRDVILITRLSSCAWADTCAQVELSGLGGDDGRTRVCVCPHDDPALGAAFRAGIRALREMPAEDIIWKDRELSSSKYLNNMIAQDHRGAQP
jgi:hypothetical protein